MDKEKRLRSTHIFIFPFKILNEMTMEDKENRKNKILAYPLEWSEYNPKQEKTDKDKNLMKYFNKYAKDSLFRYGNDKNDSYVMELHNEKLKGHKFEISYQEKSYILDIEDIKIKFFDTSVGTLSFVLNNYEKEKIEDVLMINNQGRKIYSAYVGEDCSKIKIFRENFEIFQDISESSIAYEGSSELLYNNNIIGYFLNLKKIEPMLDDRMYTMCQYLEDKDLFGEDSKESQFKKYWYQYIFVDTYDFKMCQDEKMEKELLEKASYMRWKNFGTYYGISRYSFMLWTNIDFNEKNKFSLNVLNVHMKTLYFQMLSLLIAQKSTIVLLNEQINNILEKNGSEENEYNEYLTYLSKLNFREITHQEQGIELYNLCRNQMGIQELTEELNLKVKTLNDKAERDRDKEEAEAESRQQKTIEMYGMILAILGAVLGILGISETYLETTPKEIMPGIIIAGQENIFGFIINYARNNSSIVSIAVVLFIAFILHFYRREK